MSLQDRRMNSGSLAGTSTRRHWFPRRYFTAFLAASVLLLGTLPCQASTFPPASSASGFTVPHSQRKYRAAILFPAAQSTVVADPSRFFAQDLLNAPLPTNSFFQNFVIREGNQTEYIHPYLIRSSEDGLTLSYPTRNHSTALITQIFSPDLTVSALPGGSSPSTSRSHVISSFDDLSVTLDLPPALCFNLVRGSPYVTASTLQPTRISLSSVHGFLSVTSNPKKTKHHIHLNGTGQTFLCYSSAPLDLAQTGPTRIESASSFSGVLRLAVLLDPAHEPVLDQFSARYPVSGSAEFTAPFQVEYRWRMAGRGYRRLLLLAHPLHLRLLDRSAGGVQVLDGFRYRSIDGDLVGVVAETWTLKSNPVPITWHSIGGLNPQQELVSAIRADVKNLSSNPIATNASYFYGKAVARAARMALIAEEACVPDAIPPALDFVKKSIEPWLDGSFKGNGFLYDPKWRGLVTKNGLSDPAGDFGFGIYNDHHFHLGYFLYGIAVVSKFDRSWGRKYRPQAYTMVADILTRSRNKPGGSPYTRLRCFDMWKLHSWAAGLTEFADGRNQESTSEAVNAYYSAALLGQTYGDTHLTALASTLTALEISAAQTWWHVRRGDGIYEEEFTENNRVVGVLWNNKRDTGLWFAPATWREARMGIQVLPLSPITEVLFPDAGYVRDLVDWTLPALSRRGVGEGWKGFLYAMEGIYDREGALKKTRTLKGHDDGNSLSNMLWWLYSRRTYS